MISHAKAKTNETKRSAQKKSYEDSRELEIIKELDSRSTHPREAPERVFLSSTRGVFDFSSRGIFIGNCGADYGKARKASDGPSRLSKIYVWMRRSVNGSRVDNFVDQLN